MKEKKYEVKHGVCRCGHFEQEHRGFYWFHPTGCKIENCDCEKYLSIGQFTFDEAPKSAQENVLVD